MEPITPIKDILMWRSIFYPLMHMEAMYNPYSSKSILFIHEMFLEPHMLTRNIIQPSTTIIGKQFGAIAIYEYEPV